MLAGAYLKSILPPQIIVTKWPGYIVTLNAGTNTAGMLKFSSVATWSWCHKLTIDCCWWPSINGLEVHSSPLWLPAGHPGRRKNNQLTTLVLMSDLGPVSCVLCSAVSSTAPCSRRSFFIFSPILACTSLVSIQGQRTSPIRGNLFLVSMGAS